MHDFLLKELSGTNIVEELLDIGYDSSYANKAVNKFEYKNFKIYNLNCAQANILKQLALSVGADCGTNKEVIRGGIESSDAILGGSISQLSSISNKLKLQPFGLKNLGNIIEEKISSNSVHKTKIIGILNLTKNSFSDGGKFYEYENAIKHLHKMIDDGADIIDIGAESTKPYSEPVKEEQQIKIITPILEYINKNGIKIPISIDTRSAKTAQTCIDLGANIINDVSGFDYDKNMTETIAHNPQTKIIIQHSKGTPENMQNNPHYENLTDEIYKNLKEKVDYAEEKGILKSNIILDAGIGFGKTKKDNLELIKRWKEFKTIGCPILLGLSRKSFLGIESSDNKQKDLYTLAFNSILINNSIDYIRVHNVEIHKKFLNIIENS